MEIVERKETKPRQVAKPANLEPAKLEPAKKAMEIEEKKEIKEPALKKTGGAVKRLFTKRKKLVIISAMVALLCVTVYFNFALNGRGPSQETGGNVQVCMFTTFRNNRANERARDIMVYENLIATSQNAETVAAAEARLLAIRADVAFETNAENLMLTIGHAESIVNRTNGFVNVILRRDYQIDRAQAIQILSTLRTIKPDLDVDSMHINIM